MAASAYNIILTNGQTVSVYQASGQAINTNPVVTMQGTASVANVTTDFSVMSDCYIQDVVVSTVLSAGGVEVYNVSRGQRSIMGVSNLETYTTNNTTRNPPRIGFRAGQVYRFIQTTAGNA